MLTKRLILWFLLLPTIASAHSPLLSQSPQDGEILRSPPTQISLEFKSPARVIKLELIKQKSKDSSILAGSGENDTQSVKVARDQLPNKPDSIQVVPLVPLNNGSYLVAWRALGKDGHLIKGNFSFTISDQ